MPAKLVISDGSSAPAKEFWVERSFLKVGTAAADDVRLPLADGAAGGEIAIYVQFREGRYEVFNKDCGSVAVDSRSIARGESGAWSAREKLRLDDRVEIELVIEGDPAPSPRAAFQSAPRAVTPRPAAIAARPADDLRPTTVAAPPPASGFSGTQIAQLGVTVACLLACGLMVVLKSDVGAAAPAGGDTFDRLVAAGLSEPVTPDAEGGAIAGNAETKRQLTQRLQAAEAAYLAGDKQTALSRYGQLKRWLDPARGDGNPMSPDTPEGAFLHRVAEFVDFRVRVLAESHRPR